MTERDRRDELDADEPGAPPGFLLDTDDDHTHRPVLPAPRTGKPGEEDDEA